jgi:hypothetical protein
MNRKDLGLFLVAIGFLIFFYVIFNSDVFQNAFLANFPSLVKLGNNGINQPSALGNIVTMLLTVFSFIFIYLLLLNI